MAQNVNPTFIKTPNFGIAQISTGTTTATAVTVYTGGTNGSKINALIAVGVNTTGSFDVLWGVSTGAAGGFINVLGAAAVAANAGFVSTVPSANLLSNSNVPLPIDSDGNPFLFLPSSAYSIYALTQALSSIWGTGISLHIVAPSVGDF